MYKFGGLYLDTDFVVLKCMDSLGSDWLARQSESEMNSAAMSVSMDRVGREFITRVLEEVSTSYRPDLWLHNGPGAVERVLAKFCNTTQVQQFSRDTCRGFHVYNPELMYPVPYPEYESIFAAGDVDLEGAYTVHLWNKLSQSLEVQLDSPYDKLTKLHCPLVRELYNIVNNEVP